jgi:hypothetical protein
MWMISRVRLTMMMRRSEDKAECWKSMECEEAGYMKWNTLEPI